MRVLGTAGHVDHGKSTLVQALTGINPDRLREEQERQMTIDLGFAWLRLPDGEEIGLVDVPGHRDFIENMLAGVSGIDAVLLVVAADEGVMPQTREHLAILDLLEVPRGVVALTKVDLVDDPAWLDLVAEDVRQLLASTSLAEAPIIAVSSVTGTGLDQLLSALTSVLRSSPARPDLGRPRLPIDRAFTMAGFGTVVTGTLTGGTLEVGQEVEVLPSALRARIRGLQTHKTKVERAGQGSRTAANLVGVEVNDLERGDVLARPGTYTPTHRIDVRFRLLDGAGVTVRHDQRVKVFIGSAQRIGRVRLLDREEVKPGEEAWIQLVLDRPLVAERGDHFILRRPSPGMTLGGGRVVDPQPARLHRRKDPAVLEQLERQHRGTPADLVVQALSATGPAPLGQVLERAGLPAEQQSEAVAETLSQGRLVLLGESSPAWTPDTWAADAATWAALVEKIRDLLAAYHRANPLRLGMPREELKSRLMLEGRVFSAVAAAAAEKAILADEGTRARLPEHQIRLTPAMQSSVKALLARFRQAPYATPSVKECLEAVGDELFAHLLESGQLIQLSSEVVLEADAYQEMVARVTGLMTDSGTATVAQVRDLFGTSRKYALALMEHLDRIGLTVREGDERRLAGSA
jgi:selenocysteine-specific elongation factor